MLTNRDFHLQTGNLGYKTGFSFTKWESCVTNGILGLLFTEKIGRAYKYCQDIERGSCGMSIETLILLSSSLNVTMDYIIYGYEDTEPKTPEQLLEMEAVEELLGHCSEKKRSYAMELLRLFLKACDEK